MRGLILVVDDHEPSVRLLRILLGGRGHRVVGAADAREARNMVRTLRPDLVLMDAYLPDADGLQLAREFKAESALAAVPIIAVTSHPTKADAERLLAAGCAACMCKPLDRDELLAVIQRYCRCL